MNESMILVLACFAGVLLGALFFGGLWWTVRRGVASPRPALWFLGSGLVRMSIVLAGFYFVSDGQLRRLLLCLLGFVIARVAVMWLTRSSESKPSLPSREASHAP